MPRRCIAAGCDTKSEMRYSLHSFSQNKELQKRWVRAVNDEEATGMAHCRVQCCV